MREYKCYKIVQHDLTSMCLNSQFPSRYRVAYKVGEFVKPNVAGTKLFAFDTLEEAQSFRNTDLDFRLECVIYEAVGRGKCTTAKPIRIGYLDELEKYWNSFQLFKRRKKRMPEPYNVISDFRGTKVLSFDEIKLVKEVK